MNILAGYDSSDEENETEEKEITALSEPSAPLQQTTVPSGGKTTTAPAHSVQIAAASKNGTKKRKTLDISFLPKGIQEALARGDSMRDSDDEEEATSRTTKRDPTSTTRGHAYLEESGLLRMLPQPKSQSYADSKSNASIKSQQHPSSTNASGAEQPEQKKSSFNFSYSTAAPAAVESKAPLAAPLSGGGITLKTFSSVPNPANSKFARVSSAPPAAASTSNILRDTGDYYNINNNNNSGNSRSRQFSPGERSSSNYVDGSDGSVALSAANSQRTAYSDSKYGEGYDTQGSVDQSIVMDVGNKKKKQRSIEQQLMSGDFSAISNNSGVSVQEVQNNHKWNALAYQDQQQREKMVQQGFGIGVNPNISQPTRSHSRKHQITSLAFQAAQTELAMLDSKSARSKTKSETQGKYGW